MGIDLLGGSGIRITGRSSCAGAGGLPVGVCLSGQPGVSARPRGRHLPTSAEWAHLPGVPGLPSRRPVPCTAFPRLHAVPHPPCTLCHPGAARPGCNLSEVKVAHTARDACGTLRVKYPCPMTLGPPVVAPKLPSVDHLPPAAVQSMFNAMIGALPADLRAADLRIRMAYNHLTRLADKAIREYQSARNAVQAFDSITLSESVPFEVVGEKGYQLRLVTDHLENCLDATHRSVCAAKLFRDKGIGPNAPVPDKRAADRLTGMRHALQHSLERLIGENLRADRRPFGPKDPYGLCPLEHELTIGAEPPLSYAELVGLMESCYRAAEVIGGRAGQS